MSALPTGPTANVPLRAPTVPLKGIGASKTANGANAAPDGILGDILPMPVRPHDAYVPLPALPSFGALLRRYRERAGYAKHALDERAGMGGSQVLRLERGDRYPTRPTVEALAAALELGDGERAVLLLSAGFVPPDLCDAVALPAIRRVVRTLGNLEGEARDQCAADLSAVCRRWARVPRHPALVEG